METLWCARNLHPQSIAIGTCCWSSRKFCLLFTSISRGRTVICCIRVRHAKRARCRRHGLPPTTDLFPTPAAHCRPTRHRCHPRCSFLFARRRHRLLLRRSARSEDLVIGSYFDKNSMPHYNDIQAVTQQLGEWLNDPLRKNENPALVEAGGQPFLWRQRSLSSLSAGTANAILLLPPLLPATLHGKHYHLENMALLPWFAQSATGPYSFSRY